MANDNQTALMQSIRRKKSLISNLEFERSKLPAGSCGSLHKTTKIKVLRDEITEDEKLLAVEKSQRDTIIKDSFFSGWEECVERAVTQCVIVWSESAEEVYNQMYGTDETT